MAKSPFTGRDSYERLEQLQALCSSADVDALLLVGGADSRFSRGCSAALQYLFLGKSGQELLGEQVIPQAFETLEDVVLVVTRHSADIFYPLDSDSATFLLPLIACWRNLTEHVAPDDVPQDDRELIKIRSFRDMVAPYKRLGVPMGSFDSMAIERWPLVQAFGLENDGIASATAVGFFTMQHVAVDIETALFARMLLLDNYYARRLVLEATPALRLHYESALTKLDHASHASERHAKSELDWGDDVISYYEFGTIRHAARGLSPAKARGARVLFGTRTLLPETASNETLPDHAGVEGFSATHLLWTAEEPLSGLRVARTYMLGTGRVAARVIDKDALVHPCFEKLDRYDDMRDNGQDVRFVLALYEAVLQAHAEAIDAFVVEAKSQAAVSSSSVRATALTALRRLVAPLEATYDLPAAYLETHFQVTLECLDACGEPVTETTVAKWSQWYLTTSLSHVPSQCAKMQPLGSLVVGDTLLLQKPTRTHLVVTRGFEYIKTWTQAGKEADFASHLDDALASEHMLVDTLRLGKELGDAIPKALLLVQCPHLPLLRGVLKTYTSGLVFQSANCNPIVISFANDVASLQVLSTPDDALLLLLIEFRDRQTNPVRASFPLTLLGSSIALPLVANSRMQADVMRLLDTWKASLLRLDIPFHRPHDNSRGEKDVPTHFMPGIQRVLGLDADAATKQRLFPHWYISKAVAQVSSWAKPKTTSKLLIPISVFLGVPGSDVHALSMALADISGATNAWHHVVVDVRLGDQQSLERTAVQQLHASVATAVGAIAAQSSWDLRPRILLTVIGYVDCMTVAAAIKMPPAHWALPTKLSTLTCCLSGAALLQPTTANPLPKLWDQLTAGFATYVVLSHTAELSRTALHRLRTRIDAANPFADVFCPAYRDRHFPNWIASPETYSVASTAGHAVGFRIGAAIDRARFLACVQHGLTPHATLKSIEPSSALKAAPAELTGLRLAQSLAMHKVAQSLKAQSPAIAAEQVAALTADCGAVWSIEATLTFADDSAHGYQYLNSGVKATLKPTAAPSAATCSVVFTGVQLNASALKTLLLACCPTKYEPVRPLQSGVSLVEKRQIQADHVHDPLPDGYVFDGTYYYDYFGGQYEFHPAIDSFVQAYVASKKDVATRQTNELEQDRRRFEELTERIV
ncbi:hypothetical protein SPRG_14787 [Saprolegnia parasitica CBS 223.65]|uniref:Uncharacterized protein n=1 Tax=Saprolegnia parasitica (strain CBS 223.65) TaxID=695850 RepID=A0A067BY11_SAPPC|nr:hypothetical protein SPRG_14787 [Saprolegnia parasitica CBS 223.65]KDO19176.1 hypothetical protein SPRG_14787 [Saprolegnia parasitica CBS 223.65]|eukprot:XP_012210111.1 hypothetical protein SPRG_14787 [Saprolegnia parasitica CBS 223.65]